MAKTNLYNELYTQYTKSAKEDKSIEFAVQWFFKQIRTIYSKTTIPIKTAQQGMPLVSGQSMKFGKMYVFEYRAKKTEEYYDRFPIVLPFTIGADHIVGFNLHYLPTKYRLIAIRAILHQTNIQFPPQLNDVTKVDYDKINGSTLNFMRIAVRTYKFKQIKSVVGVIPTKSWITASFLPIALFKGTPNTVNGINKLMIDAIRNI